MNTIIVILTIMFTSFIGYALIRFFRLITNDNLLAIGLSYGLGAGLVSFQIFIYSTLNIALKRELIIMPWLMLFLFFPRTLKLKNLQRIKFPKLRSF